MSEALQNIKETIRHTPYLIVDADNDRAELLSRPDAMRAMTDGHDTVALIVDVSRCLAAFQRLTAGREQFDIADLVKVTATPKSTVNHWITVGLIVPSIRPAQGSGRYNTRLFSAADAFRAGLIGSLRRHGVALPMIRRLLRLLSTQEQKKPGSAATL